MSDDAQKGEVIDAARTEAQPLPSKKRSADGLRARRARRKLRRTRSSVTFDLHIALIAILLILIVLVLAISWRAG